MALLLSARHRAWLKRRALDRQLAAGGHDSMSVIVAELIDREIEGEPAATKRGRQ